MSRRKNFPARKLARLEGAFARRAGVYRKQGGCAWGELSALERRIAALHRIVKPLPD